MFGLGPMEMAIILLVAVLLFGSQLPKIARNVGSSIPQFKRGVKEVENEIAQIEAKTQELMKKE